MILSYHHKRVSTGIEILLFDEQKSIPDVIHVDPCVRIMGVRVAANLSTGRTIVDDDLCGNSNDQR